MEILEALVADTAPGGAVMVAGKKWAHI